MKGKKLLSAAIAAAMCLNLFVGTGFAADDADDNINANQFSDDGGNALESPAGDGDTSKSENDAAWTICVYLCGSDLESDGSAASGDLLEMLESVQDSDFPKNVNLLVMTGGAEAWDPEGLIAKSAGDRGLGYLEPSAERVELFKITPKRGMESLTDDLDNWIEEDRRWTLTNNNMADPNTAKIFGSFAIDEYPAEHMMYVFWDHGGAFIAGCELDRIHDEILSSADVNEIIDTLRKERGKKLDLVGFDACLMSGMEMAQVLSDSADYMLASEEVEPGSGWDYQWLGNIFRESEGEKTADDIGREIIDLYPGGFASHDETCNGKDNIWNHAGETTLALTDLSKIDGLINAFDDMAAAMGAFADNKALSDHFADLGFAISQSAGSAYQENLLDVYDYAQNVVELYTDGNSSLYDHQNARDHTECAALYDAAQEVSGYFTFDGAPKGVLLSGTGNNPIVYRGRGKQAARGGLSVFGPVLSSKQVDSHSEAILELYGKLGLLGDYSNFIETLNSKKQEIGNFTGSMNVTSTVNESNERLVSTLSVKPRNTGVSVVEVNAQIAYTDLSTGKSYWLGEMPVDTSNRKDMEFTYTFDGTWQTLNGKFCTMNIQSSDNAYMFTIPAYVKDGSRKVPVMVITQAVEFKDESISALALGYMEIPEKAGEAEVTNRITMMGTDVGQKSELTFRPVLVSDGSRMDDPAGWTEAGTEVTVGDSDEFILSIGIKKLTSGRNNLYEARFALTDIMGKTHISSSEPFFVISDINDFSAVPIRPQVYEAGKPATPPVHLFFGAAELVQGEDFEVEYTGNDRVPTPGNPVTATVTITDKHPQEGSSRTRTLDFLICTEEDYESTYMNWIADILNSTKHVPGDEGTELATEGLLLDMFNPLDEYIVHAVLAEELQLRYDLCTAAERGFFTQDRVNVMRRHYNGATRDKKLTSNGVTLVGALKLMDAYGYLSLIGQPESGLKVTTGQPSAAQLDEWNVDGQYFTEALADARAQNGSVTIAQTYNPVFQVKVPVNDLAWEIVVENLSEGGNIENLDDAELARRYEEAQAQIREMFGDVEYVERPLRQTGESEDLRLVLKIAVPSGYYENTASLYRIDGTGCKKLGEEDGLHFVTENGVSYAVFETRALHEGCWYTMTAVPKPANTDTGNADNGDRPERKPNTSNTSNQNNNTSSNTNTTPDTAPDTSNTPSGTQSNFTDVPAGAWYESAVAFVESRGLMSGSNGRFSPDENLSRGMLAQILFNAEGRPAGNAAAAFTDVPTGAWFADAVAWAAAKNIVSGYGNGQFGPNDSITREQLAVMLWRYAGSPAPTNQTLSFPDADAVGGYARTALCWAVEKGIMNGIGGRLDPKGAATRAQVAQMLKSFIENQT